MFEVKDNVKRKQDAQMCLIEKSLEMFFTIRHCSYITKTDIHPWYMRYQTGHISSSAACLILHHAWSNSQSIPKQLVYLLSEFDIISDCRCHSWNVYLLPQYLYYCKHSRFGSSFNPVLCMFWYLSMCFGMVVDNFYRQYNTNSPVTRYNNETLF